jgi:hypothetical protein
MLSQQIEKTLFRIAIEKSSLLLPFTVSVLEGYVHDSVLAKRTAEALHG